MVNLALVPKDHPLRNTPLGVIDAHYQFLGNHENRIPAWPQPRGLSPGMPINKATYNDLRNGWIEYYSWYA